MNPKTGRLVLSGFVAVRTVERQKWSGPTCRDIIHVAALDTLRRSDFDWARNCDMCFVRFSIGAN